MEGREAHRPLYPNDKTIPSPLGLGIEPRGGECRFWAWLGHGVFGSF